MAKNGILTHAPDEMGHPSYWWARRSPRPPLSPSPPLPLYLSLASSFRQLSLLALALVLAGGCTGGGVVHTLPITRTDFQPGEPPILSVPLTEAYYWIDGASTGRDASTDGDASTGDDASTGGEVGTLNIALGYRTRSLLGKPYDSEWFMSIVLVDGLPAGSEKLYLLRRREIQMVQSRGADHRRGRCISGCAVIEAPGMGRLKGRFHAFVREQRFGVLTGWAPAMNRAPILIMAGEFEAVRDPVRGRAILARTEADGFVRPPRDSATTQPGGARTPTIRWLHSRPAGAAPAPPQESEHRHR